MSHTFALGDTFLHYDEHGRCSLFGGNPSYTILLLILTPSLNPKSVVGRQFVCHTIHLIFTKLPTKKSFRGVAFAYGVSYQRFLIHSFRIRG